MYKLSCFYQKVKLTYISEYAATIKPERNLFLHYDYHSKTYENGDETSACLINAYSS